MWTTAKRINTIVGTTSPRIIQRLEAAITSSPLSPSFATQATLKHPSAPMFSKIAITLLALAAGATTAADLRACLTSVEKNVEQYIQLNDVVYLREQDAPCLQEFQDQFKDVVDPCPPHIMCVGVHGLNNTTSKFESCFRWKGILFCDE
ncbi:hypothetical protein FI667_g13389, partial [Globisporangium splendens]